MVYSHTVTYGAALGRYDIASNARAFDTIRKKKKIEKMYECTHCAKLERKIRDKVCLFECMKMFFKLRFN